MGNFLYIVIVFLSAFNLSGVNLINFQGNRADIVTYNQNTTINNIIYSKYSSQASRAMEALLKSDLNNMLSTINSFFGCEGCGATIGVTDSNNSDTNQLNYYALFPDRSSVDYQGSFVPELNTYVVTVITLNINLSEVLNNTNLNYAELSERFSLQGENNTYSITDVIKELGDPYLYQIKYPIDKNHWSFSACVYIGDNVNAIFFSKYYDSASDVTLELQERS